MLMAWSGITMKYMPCDPARKPGVETRGPLAFTAARRFIHIRPRILDKPKGRILAPYKKEVLIREYIENFSLLPLLLFREPYHTTFVTPDRKFLRFFSPENFPFRSQHHIVRFD